MALTLVGGWLLKGQCRTDWSTYRQYSHLCYNDIQPLWAGRGISDRLFPYVDARIDKELRADGSVDYHLTGAAIEYPVLTGMFMYLSGTWAETDDAYLVHSALLLAPFALLAAFLLARLEGTRALLFAAAPAIVLYAFHNWDLLVVAAAVGGFYAYRRGSPMWAAAIFAIGAAFKMYPAFFVAPLVLESLHRKEWKTAGAITGTAFGVFGLINLPFVLANASGWWTTYRFHQIRTANFDNIWTLRDTFQIPIDLPGLPEFTFGFVLPSLDPAALNTVTSALTLLFFAVALGAGWVRANREGAYPVVPVAAAMLVAFLLVGKVHSPQYTLWLLPFFVLVRLNVLWWAAYSAVDLMVYVGVFRFFYDYTAGTGETAARTAMEAGVWIRAGLLGVLFVVFLLARSSGGDDETDPEPVSHPVPSLDPVGARASAS